MRIQRVLNTGILGTMLVCSVCSCEKKPYYEMSEVPYDVKSKMDLIRHNTTDILRDTSYHTYGYDTVKINKDFYHDKQKYLESLTQKAIKQTPKTEIGKHIEIQMIPKRGGGFDQIPVLKKDYKPDFKDQRPVIQSNKVFTTDGKTLYIPVEYYGRLNN